MKPFAMLMKRELWENRSFWITPMVIAVLSLLMALWGMGMMIFLSHTGIVQSNFGVVGADGPTALSILLFAGSGIFNLVLFIMVTFYLLDALYGDRRDRSVMFWRSMPVSDTRTVLSKLATAMVTAPLITLAIIIAMEFLTMLLFALSTMFMGGGFDPWPIIGHPGIILYTWVVMALAFLVQAVWYLPFWGWFLLTSAWAKKGPFLWATLVPVGLIFLEGTVFKTAHIARMIGDRAGGGLFRIMSDHNSLNTVWVNAEGHIGHTLSGNLVTFTQIGHVLVSPQLWIGALVGAIFTAGAIWLRHNRSEN